MVVLDSSSSSYLLVVSDLVYSARLPDLQQVLGPPQAIQGLLPLSQRAVLLRVGSL